MFSIIDIEKNVHTADSFPRSERRTKLRPKPRTKI